MDKAPEPVYNTTAVINPELDVRALRRRYAEKRRLYIPEFLEPRAAEALYRRLRTLDSQDLWYQVRFGNPRYLPRGRTRAERYEKAFSYSYEKYPLLNQSPEEILSHDSRRSVPPALKAERARRDRAFLASKPIADFLAAFDDGEGREFIQGLTGLRLPPKSLVAYGAKYSPGDYNTPHSDYAFTRKVTVVTYLTKDWLVHWGGAFGILDEEGDRILEAYNPEFNSALVFDVPLFHYVMPVSQYAQLPRYALTCWYHDLTEAEGIDPRSVGKPY